MRYASLSFLCLLLLLGSFSARSQSIESVKNLGLTVIEIETIDHELPTCDYVNHPAGNNGKSITNMTNVPGRLTMTRNHQVVYDSGDYEEDNSGMRIRIRGNASAWDHNPKPYKVKLEKKADLLFRGNDSIYKDKNWLLLKDLKLNNMIGLWMGELVGMKWTPAFEYVNVFVNGDYYGVYMLCESVRRNPKCRLNVDETGYIFEYDQYWWNEPLYVESSFKKNPLKYTFKYPQPEDITEEQLTYIETVITQMEQSIQNGTYTQYIDIDSFARWLLSHELLGNSDGTGSNLFLTKYDNTENTKVMMPNLWDLAGIFVGPEKFATVHNNHFFSYLMNPNTQHKEFINTYFQLWDALSPTVFQDIKSRIAGFMSSNEAKAITKSTELENQKFNKDTRDVDYYMECAIHWFELREPWLTHAIDSIRSEATGIHTIPIEQQEERVYDLNGRPRKYPQQGINIICGKDGTRKKVIIK